MKKISCIILLVLSIFLCVFFISWDVGTGRYNDMIVDTGEFENIISLRTESDGLVDEIIFDEELLFCDEKNNIYYYSLVEDSSSSNNPYIKLTAHNNLKIAFLNEKITEDIIKNNMTIDFIVYTDQYYHQYGLKCTTLPLMNISCLEEIGDDSVDMNIVLFDNGEDVIDRFTLSDGTIHVRGASTRGLPKKSYRISLVQTSLGGNKRNNNVSLLGMRQDDDWLLYSAYNEGTKVKNVFSCNLWENSCAANNSIGADTGMEYRYLELFINNEYWGLYALGFPIDSKQLNLQKGMGELYKKNAWATETSLEGYKTKGYGTGDRDYLREFYEYLNENKYDNEALTEYIDINNLIDIRLFINLIQGTDNVGIESYYCGEDSTYLKNIYLCIREIDNGLIGLYCPWDLDITWNRNPNVNCLIETGYLEQMIANGNTDIIKLMCDRYRTLRETYWSDESLVEMLDDLEDDIYGSGAYLREYERWSDGRYKENFDAGLSDFKGIVLARAHEADSYYLRLEENMGESYYVMRSLQYEDFQDYNFIIKIGNHDLFEESEYRDLLEYIGIDVGQIDESVKFIAVNGEDKKVEYIKHSVNVGEVMETCAGTLYLNPEPKGDGYVSGVYSVYIDDLFSFNTNDYLEQDISLIFIGDGRVEPFNFSKDFILGQFENRIY